MAGKTTALRKLLAEEAFIHMPVAYDALGGGLIGPAAGRHPDPLPDRKRPLPLPRSQP